MQLSQISSRTKTSNGPLSYNRRKLSPMVETVESRALMTCGPVASSCSGFLCGMVTLDNSQSSPVQSVTVELFKTNSSKPVATTTTDSNGMYTFNNLAPGDYLIKELAPKGYTASGAQANSQVNPASVVSADTIKVTVTNPSSVYVNYGGVAAGSYQVVDNTINGQEKVNSVGPFNDTLGTAAGKTNINGGFQTFCVNDLQNLSFGGGESYQVVPRPVTALTNGNGTISADHAGRIAYLYNHFGNSALNNINGPALQLAIWELLYDQGNTPDFTAGNYKVNGPSDGTSQADFNAVIAQAKTYFNQSAGHHEDAMFLDAATPSPCNPNGRQSVLANCSLDFTVHSSCDSHGNNNGCDTGHGGNNGCDTGNGWNNNNNGCDTGNGGNNGCDTGNGWNNNNGCDTGNGGNNNNCSPSNSSSCGSQIKVAINQCLTQLLNIFGCGSSKSSGGSCWN